MREADKFLPGYPSKSLIQKVRRQLGRYGIRVPGVNYGELYVLWRMTWEWAAAQKTTWTKRPSWPSCTEIATQYVVLLVCHMRSFFQLRLSVMARDKMPASVRALFLTAHRPELRSQVHLFGTRSLPHDASITGA